MEPFSEKAIDQLRNKGVADFLELFQCFATEKSIVQSLELYTGFWELAFCPFMAVEAYFDPPGGVAAYLDKPWAKSSLSR